MFCVSQFFVAMAERESWLL